MKKYLLAIVSLLFSIICEAQQVEMADKLREDGKIYAVLAVILTIFTGIIVYLFVLDKKISKLENKDK